MTRDGSAPDRVLAQFLSASEQCLGRAGESLSELLGHPVRLTVSAISLVPVRALPALASETASGPKAGLRISFGGVTAGQIVILFPLATLFRILGMLVGAESRGQSLSEMERSAVLEVGNILASSFLSGLADLLGGRLMSTPPELHVDNLPRMMGRVAAGFEGRAAEVLVVEALFEDPGRRIEGRFYFLPEAASLSAALQAAPDGGQRVTP
jgi:chemotaxis protein CheC